MNTVRSISKKFFDYLKKKWNQKDQDNAQRDTEELIISKPLLGFRKWKTDDKNHLLTASIWNSAWQPGINHATGCSEKHTSPAPMCHCGFNAWFDFDDNKTSNYNGVIGSIAGAGKVELHSQGFRSQKAQIIALYVEKEKDLKRYRPIAETYGVPIFSGEKEAFEEFSKQHATSIHDIKEFNNSESKGSSDSFVPQATSDLKARKMKNSLKVLFWFFLWTGVIHFIFFDSFSEIVFQDYIWFDTIYSSSSSFLGLFLIVNVFLFISAMTTAVGFSINSFYKRIIFPTIATVVLAVNLILLFSFTSFDEDRTSLEKRNKNLVAATVELEEYYKTKGKYPKDLKSLKTDSSKEFSDDFKLSYSPSENNQSYNLSSLTVASPNNKITVSGTAGKQITSSCDNLSIKESALCADSAYDLSKGAFVLEQSESSSEDEPAEGKAKKCSLDVGRTFLTAKEKDGQQELFSLPEHYIPVFECQKQDLENK